MGRIIIDNRSSHEDWYVIGLVQEVIANGRVSNYGKQYCYLSTFGRGDQMVAVATDLNKASDRFVISDYPDKSRP